ncbi:ABC transporter ATP-binding protein [Muricoccus radiodurans]|uniref:ABC transporter ATP-binding protein n=1 Tax=Muricoccus radiodurans TaxID=2231721 RepID=UPI003CF146E2
MSSAGTLEVRDLSVTFRTERGPLRVLDGIGFSLPAGRTVALVGESGCGKSVASLAVMGLLPPGTEVGGAIRLEGREIAELPAEDRRQLRGRDMAMIFQEPMTSLNPAFTAGEQVAEALRLHQGLDRAAAARAAVAMLESVRIPEAARRARQYPHQLSGGMRQRVMIAMALACRPRVLIADEPTTALDVTVQAQILALLDELRGASGTAVLLITHDLGIVADHADEVVVMYAGRVAESGPAAQVLATPQHPYTIGLLGAAPRLDGPRGTRLATVEGTVPDLADPPEGCRFKTRCPFRIPVCDTVPALREIAPGQRAACHRAPLDTLLDAAA